MGIMEVIVSGRTYAEVSARIMQEWFDKTLNGRLKKYFTFEFATIQAVEMANREEPEPRSIFIKHSHVENEHFDNDHQWQVYSKSGGDHEDYEYEGGPTRRVVCKIRCCIENEKNIVMHTTHFGSTGRYLNDWKRLTR